MCLYLVWNYKCCILSQMCLEYVKPSLLSTTQFFLLHTYRDRHPLSSLQNLTNKPGGFLKQVLLCGLGGWVAWIYSSYAKGRPWGGWWNKLRPDKMEALWGCLIKLGVSSSTLKMLMVRKLINSVESFSLLRQVGLREIYFQISFYLSLLHSKLGWAKFSHTRDPV